MALFIVSLSINTFCMWTVALDLVSFPSFQVQHSQRTTLQKIPDNIYIYSFKILRCNSNFHSSLPTSFVILTSVFMKQYRSMRSTSGKEIHILVYTIIKTLYLRVQCDSYAALGSSSFFIFLFQYVILVFMKTIKKVRLTVPYSKLITFKQLCMLASE